MNRDSIGKDFHVDVFQKSAVSQSLIPSRRQSEDSGHGSQRQNVEVPQENHGASGKESYIIMLDSGDQIRHHKRFIQLELVVGDA